ncbi:MAG: Fic family protein, partial [Bacteroidota bacterium]|nr:Fic family protein [Bacteroidota bacterium]
HHTTHIEGTRLTLSQAEAILDGKVVQEADPDDVRELLNYRATFEFVSAYLKSQAPITEGLIREIHKRLVEDVRGGAAAPGEYRKIQNHVVNAATGETVYTPPPALEVPLLMSQFVEWLNRSQEIHPVLVSGIAQFQLVHIHPFLDGNGRTSRLLSMLILYRSGYDFKRLFTLSEYYDRQRSRFYRALQSVRENDMDMTVWLEYFTEGLATQLSEVKQKAERIIKADAIAAQHHLSPRQHKALRYLLEHGTLTIQKYEELCPGVSRRTLQRDLAALAEKELIAVEGATNRLIHTLKKL